MEIFDISLDNPPLTGPGKLLLPPKQQIQDISCWIEKISLMTAAITSRFPGKAPELFNYQSSIVQTERNFEDCQWVSYDGTAIGKPSWTRTSTGQWPTFAYIRRHSLATQDLFHDVSTASRKTTPILRRPQKPHPTIVSMATSTHNGTPNPPHQPFQQSNKCCSCFNDGRCCHSAATSTSVWNAEEPTHRISAPALVKRVTTDPDLHPTS